MKPEKKIAGIDFYTDLVNLSNIKIRIPEVECDCGWMGAENELLSWTGDDTRCPMCHSIHISEYNTNFVEEKSGSSKDLNFLDFDKLTDEQKMELIKIFENYL